MRIIWGKKRNNFWLVFVLFYALLMVQHSVFAQAPKADWTIMVYMNGDNNLETEAVADFLEMAKVGSDDHVNIIASFNLVDLDADYQSILPNLNTVVNAPGGVVRTATGETDQTQITTNTITVDIAGAGSPVGRIEIDPALGETGPLYVIPSEDQRPRLVTQSIV